MRKPTVTFHKESTKDGSVRWYWTLKAGNHEVMCNARGYNTERNARRGFERTRALMGLVE